MLLKDFTEYVNSLEELTKIEPKIEMGEDGEFYVVSTKETYVFYEEVEADNKIDAAHDNQGYESSSKKFKQGKINKNGEVTRPDQYTVVIKLNF